MTLYLRGSYNEITIKSRHDIAHYELGSSEEQETRHYNSRNKSYFAHKENNMNYRAPLA